MTTVEQARDVTNAPGPAEGRSSRSITTGAVGPIAVAGGLLSSAVTLFVLEGFTPIVPTRDVVAALLYVNGATVLVLLAIIGSDLWKLWLARRRGRAGSRLLFQFVRLFTSMAAIPAILI